MEWVEVAGKTVDDAIAAGLEELGITDREQAAIEVLQEPKSGFLGIGAQLAHVKVTPKPTETKKRRRRRRKPRSEGAAAGAPAGGQPPANGGAQRSTGPQDGGSKTGGGSTGRGEQSRQGSQQKKTSSGRRSGKPTGQPASQTQKQDQTGDRSSGRSQGKKQDRGKAAAMSQEQDGRPEATIEERAVVAATFIEGLLDAFGLEGEVTTEIEDDILKINVAGDQTEALVGPKGGVMQSVLEITRTVVQRKTYGAPRMRLDISGYGERRREALKIYAGKLAEKVLADGGEIMVEPMNPADRKVIHDAVAEIDGIRSFSEGEDPDRAVVLAPE